MLDLAKGKTLHKQKPRLLQVINQTIRSTLYGRTGKARKTGCGTVQFFEPNPVWNWINVGA
jgi:hypothetical protein